MHLDIYSANLLGTYSVLEKHGAEATVVSRETSSVPVREAESALSMPKVCPTWLDAEYLKVQSQRQISINKFVKTVPFSSIDFPHPRLAPPHQEVISRHVQIISPENSRTFAVLDAPKVLSIVKLQLIYLLILFYGPALPRLLVKYVC